MEPKAKHTKAMKRNMKLLYLAVIVTLFTFINVTGLCGQGKIDLTAGFGMPDWVNAGIRYQMGQTQVGVAAGFMPVSGEHVTSCSLDLWYHFIGTSALSDRRPWYGRFGLAWLHDKKEGSFNEKFLFLETRGGREFNLSENSGIYIDAGLMYKLYSDFGDDPVSKLIFELFWAFPAGGIGFFFRF
jgi:hypothetical protein